MTKEMLLKKGREEFDKPRYKVSPVHTGLADFIENALFDDWSWASVVKVACQVAIKKIDDEMKYHALRYKNVCVDAMEEYYDEMKAVKKIIDIINNGNF